jgi:LysR family glycine cleavage system transcriptional activator
MKRLPPLTAVEAFVQTARLGSIKAAAESLALSSPALSRRVQALERFVGKPLFERRHQAVLLNHDGAQLLAEIGPALEDLSQAMERAAGHSELMRLRIAALPLFASHRLMPRLGALRALQPDLHVELDTRPHALTRLDEGLDAAIALAKEVDESLYSVKLGSNRVVAVGGKGMESLSHPAQLAQATVLLHRDLPEALGFWLEAVGLPDLQPAAIDYFDSGQLILDAAAEGLGVAFMFEMHLEHAHDPRLVRLFDLAAPSPYAYWFACRRAALSRRPLKIFHDWLLKEVVAPEAVATA